MIRHVVLRLIASTVVLAILIVGAGFALLHLPALQEARSRIAGNLLSSYLGEAVVVSGGVELTFGPTIDVAVQGVSPVAAGRDAPVGTVSLSFSLDAALRGRLDLTAMDVSELRVIIDATAAQQSKDMLGRSVAKAVEGVLSSPLVRSLKLMHVSILRINDPAGWNGALFFETVTSRATDPTGTVSVEANGTLSGQSFKLSGKVPDLSAARGLATGDNLSLKLAFKGIEAGLEGRLAQAADGLTLAARLDIRSPSLGEVQDLLQLARVIEGTGTLVLALDGALAKPAIGSAKLRIETASGRVYEADGRAADLWDLDGLDVGFAATLVAPGAKEGKSRFDLAPRSFKGRLSGRLDGFEIDEVIVETGFALIELENLGPIRIGQIARDKKGHLRLEDIRLVQGDPKDPILDLTGHLHDALELRGFSLAGELRLEMAVLLTGRPDATGVGALRGKIAMSDASGHLRLETLDARLQGTDLMSASLHQADGGKIGERLDLKFEVPDMARLASTLGRNAAPDIWVGFDGKLDVTEGTAALIGSARVGRTELECKLRMSAPEGTPEIRGKIDAKDLHLDDLFAAREVSELFSGREVGAVKVHEDIQKATTLSLDIAADAVEGDGQTAGGLKVHLGYAQSRLRLSDVELAYLGGSIEGNLDASFAHSPPALDLKATVRQLSLGQVFERLKTVPVASGPLDLDLAVKARGADVQALLASLSGQISGSIQGGSLADRTINLAGQTIIGWLFTRSADGTAPLECVVARIEFKDGIGTARKLVLETDKVQASGSGTLNLRNETMDFVFVPRPKQSELVGKVGPVDVVGPLFKPEVKLADGAVAMKIAGETIGLPFHLLGSLFDANGQLPPEYKPCVVVPDRK